MRSSLAVPSVLDGLGSRGFFGGRLAIQGGQRCYLQHSQRW